MAIPLAAKEKQSPVLAPGPGSPAATTWPAELGRDVRRLEEAWVRQRAYKKWEEAGRPSGDGVNFWLEAERELFHARHPVP
jgi:hypothetical protein